MGGRWLDYIPGKKDWSHYNLSLCSIEKSICKTLLKHPHILIKQKRPQNHTPNGV
jgi:hypothetical protein